MLLMVSHTKCWCIVDFFSQLFTSVVRSLKISWALLYDFKLKKFIAEWHSLLVAAFGEERNAGSGFNVLPPATKVLKTRST